MGPKQAYEATAAEKAEIHKKKEIRKHFNPQHWRDWIEDDGGEDTQDVVTEEKVTNDS